MTKTELDPKEGLNVKTIVKTVLFGALALGAAFSYERLTEGPADCFARTETGIDVNPVECINDIFGTDLG